MSSLRQGLKVRKELFVNIIGDVKLIEYLIKNITLDWCSPLNRCFEMFQIHSPNLRLNNSV